MLYCRECGRPIKAKGLCAKHYSRARRLMPEKTPQQKANARQAIYRRWVEGLRAGELLTLTTGERVRIVRPLPAQARVRVHSATQGEYVAHASLFRKFPTPPPNHR